MKHDRSDFTELQNLEFSHMFNETNLRTYLFALEYPRIATEDLFV